MTERGYMYQPGDIVEMLPDAHWNSPLPGGGRHASHWAGRQMKIVEFDYDDGDLIGSALDDPSVRPVVMSECVKPIELQGVRVGDKVRIITAYHTDWDEDLPREIIDFDLEQHFGVHASEIPELAHPFVYRVGGVRRWAAKVEKIEQNSFPEMFARTLLVDLADVAALAPPARPLSWSEVRLGDIVTAEWTGLKNGVSSSAVVTSKVVEGFMGQEWYGVGIAELRQHGSPLYKVLDVERSRTVAERRKFEKIKVVRPQTTGGRWDDYALSTEGRAYVEGIADGSGRGAAYSNLTAVFEDGRGDVQLKDGDIVYKSSGAGGIRFWETVPHDQLFDLTHEPA